ncbi:two-component system histidine kinase PnpS [Aquibacillus sediminis]|uniref:two-component system histidine kinase PnpS n=1 Tax=Aquibacillus sediminis TaxID=2574734 RepID=UPI001109B464|nr:sensor histidine kinase [Aquibacillus sediminis]
MSETNSKLFYVYIFIVTIAMVCMGAIILPLTTGNETIIAGLALLGGLIVFFILIYTIFQRYIKPIRPAAEVADQLAKGNYHARTYVSEHGEIGRLSHSVNQLARSLQEMMIQDKIHSSQLKTVIDNMESGLMLVDEKGYVHLVNRKFLSIFGKDQQHYIGYLYYEVLKEEQVHQSVQQAFLYEETVKDSFTVTMKVETKVIEVVGAPIINDKQDLEGVVLVFHDITELKRLEQTRKDFVANVSHELKTPITSIKGFAETLLDGAMHDQALRSQFLTIILTESDRLQSLVHDLLELSKLEKENLRIQHRMVSFIHLVDELLPILSQQAEQKHIQLTTDIDPSVSIEGDPDLLKQLLINLLNNAINYTPSEGKVKLLIEANEEMAIITISDTGIGIPKTEQTRIFERFYRIDKARSRNTGGTGLGLAIVKHIVEVHDGTIQVESEIDRGTTFEIQLPLRQ